MRTAIAIIALLASAPAMAQNAMGSHPDTSPGRSHCSATSTPTCDEEARLPARWWTDQERSGGMTKPVSVRRSKTDGRTTRTLISYDVCHDGKVLAKIQQDAKTYDWFWYGMHARVGGNTATNLRKFEIVKAEAVARCKDFVRASASSPQQNQTEAS